MYYGLDDLDRLIAEHVGLKPPGTFVELGANDGLRQSNSKHFEEFGWRGLLIEPIPELFAQLVRNRPLARCVNCACIADDDPRREVTMLYADLMSMVDGAMPRDAQEEWLTRGEKFAGRPRYPVTVSARTLTSVITSAGLSRVDLLLLDVEGFELEVLRGLDFDRYPPRHIVAEDAYSEDVATFLACQGYRCASTLLERKFTRDRLYQPI
jgi:FkbM family methyltransferase